MSLSIPTRRTGCSTGNPDLAVYEMDDIPAVHHPDIIVKQGEIPHIWKAVVHREIFVSRNVKWKDWSIIMIQPGA